MDKTVSIVKQSGIKVMIVTECGVTWDEVLVVVDQAIKGCGFLPSGRLEYVDEEL